MSTNPIDSGILRPIGRGGDEVVNGVGPSKVSTCSKHSEEYVLIWLEAYKLWLGDCPSCKREAETGQPVPRRGQSVHDHLLDLAQIPPRFMGKSLQDFSSKQYKAAAEIAKRYDPSTGANLFIVGPIATGKSSFTCFLLADLLAQPWAAELPRGDAARYVSLPDLTESLWAASRPVDMGDYDAVTRALKEFIEVRLLVLDDVQEVHTAQELEWLERIFAGRYKEKRPTIVVGGPDLEGLAAVLGPRILDKLRGGEQIYFGKDGT
jgi:hypothetical protein